MEFAFEGMDALKRMVELEGVPTVDPADLSIVWRYIHEIQTRVRNQHVAFDVRGLQQRCRPGVNLDALWIRASFLGLMAMPELGLLELWTHDGEPDPVVFRVFKTSWPKSRKLPSLLTQSRDGRVGLPPSFSSWTAFRMSCTTENLGGTLPWMPPVPR